MKQMKTLTVNGVTYAVTDPTAPRIDDTAVGEAPWSAKKIIDTLAPAFTGSGRRVTCRPVAGYPLEVLAESEVTRCGRNLFDCDAAVTQVAYVSSNGITSKRWGFALELPAGTYTLHAEQIPESIGERYLYGVTNSAAGEYLGPNHLVVGTVRHTCTVTLSDGDVLYLYEGGGGDGKAGAQKLFREDFRVQIEVGDTATAWEPYTGAVFAPGQTVPALEGVNNLLCAEAMTVTGRADPR